MSNSNEYMRKYMLNRYHDRKKETIRILGSCCVKCGSVEDLEIDHIDPSKKSYKLMQLWSISKIKYEEELKKCQLLCKSCHKEKTLIEKSVEHGGGLSGKRNCQCAECRNRKSEYMRTYVKKKPLDLL